MQRSIAHYLEKAQREKNDSNYEEKKPKSLLGFEPGRLGQNVVALPLMPTPRAAHTKTLFKRIVRKKFNTV